MDNCLTYALRTWRFGRASDHLVIRKSHFGFFPHFAVIFELHLQEPVVCLSLLLCHVVLQKAP